MLELSFGELALIALVALLVIGPKEMPVVMRKIGLFMRKAKNMAGELHDAFDKAIDAPEIKETTQQLNRHTNYIRDEAGRLQRTYDISDLITEKDADAEVTPVAVTKTPAIAEKTGDA